MLYSSAANPKIQVRVGIKPVKKVDNTNRYLTKMHCKRDAVRRNKHGNTYLRTADFSSLLQTHVKKIWRILSSLARLKHLPVNKKAPQLRGYKDTYLFLTN